MKNTQLINRLAVSVGKISYLFKSIRKSNAQTKQLEIALLKQYAVELYDQVLALERENKFSTDTSSIAQVKSNIAEQVENIKDESKEMELPKEVIAFEEEEEEKTTIEDLKPSIEEIPAEMSSGILLDKEDENQEVENLKSSIAEVPAEMSAGLLLDKEDTPTIIEEEISIATKEETTSSFIEENEEVLAIESVSKEETMMEMVAEVEKEVEGSSLHEEITDEDATSLMNIGSDFFEEKQHSTIEEEDSHDSTVVFEKPLENHTENLPIAEKLQRTLAKLHDREESTENVVEPTTPRKEETPSSFDYSDNGEDEGATTVISTNPLTNDIDEGATTVINPSFIEQNILDPEPVEEETEPEQPILNDDNSVRTQILDDIVKNSEPSTQDHADLKLEIDGDETVALELNDVLARNSNSHSHSGTVGRKLDVSFNQRFAFINQLFKGDTDAYNSALEDLRHCEGYIQALTYVNLNLVHDYGWDSEDPVVKDFKEVIRRCFLD